MTHTCVSHDTHEWFISKSPKLISKEATNSHLNKSRTYVWRIHQLTFSARKHSGGCQRKFIHSKEATNSHLNKSRTYIWRIHQLTFSARKQSGGCQRNFIHSKEATNSHLHKSRTYVWRIHQRKYSGGCQRIDITCEWTSCKLTYEKVTSSHLKESWTHMWISHELIYEGVTNSQIVYVNTVVEVNEYKSYVNERVTISHMKESQTHSWRSHELPSYLREQSNGSRLKMNHTWIIESRTHTWLEDSRTHKSSTWTK